MSNFVEQIDNAITGVIAGVLPTYSELHHIYAIEKNNLNDNSDRYGVAVGGVSSTDGIIKSSTVDQAFQVILTQGYISSQDSDEKIRAAINELHDKMDEVLAAVYNKKAGLPQLVLVVTLDSMSEPEILEEDNVVALRMDLVVKYRRSIV
jgi:hypothetical protein